MDVGQMPHLQDQSSCAVLIQHNTMQIKPGSHGQTSCQRLNH